MTLQLTSAQVWTELKKEFFAVLGMVNAKGEARTVGILYIVHDRKLYISTGKYSWKARFVQSNPHVSITVPIARRIPVLSWIKIPAATITFSGRAVVFDAKDVQADIFHKRCPRPPRIGQGKNGFHVHSGNEPQGDFVTYGIGIPLLQMRSPKKRVGGPQFYNHLEIGIFGSVARDKSRRRQRCRHLL